MGEGVHGVALEQVTTSQRVVLTFLRGADQRCGSRISINKTQDIVHLRLTVVAMVPSMLPDNGLRVVTPLQAPMANNPITLPATLNTINNSTLNSKLVPRHTSSYNLLAVILIYSIHRLFPTLRPDGSGHSSPSSV